MTGRREALVSHTEKGACLRGVLAKQPTPVPTPVVRKTLDKAEGRDGLQSPGQRPGAWGTQGELRGHPQARGTSGTQSRCALGPWTGQATTSCVPEAVGPGRVPMQGGVEGHGAPLRG